MCRSAHFHVLGIALDEDVVESTSVTYISQLLTLCAPKYWRLVEWDRISSNSTSNGSAMVLCNLLDGQYVYRNKPKSCLHSNAQFGASYQWCVLGKWRCHLSRARLLKEECHRPCNVASIPLCGRTDRINVVDALDSEVFVHLEATILERLDAAIPKITGCGSDSNSHDNNVCIQDCLFTGGILKRDRGFRDLCAFGISVECDAFAFVELPKMGNPHFRWMRKRVSTGSPSAPCEEQHLFSRLE